MVEEVGELLKTHGVLKREVYFDIENSSIVPEEIVNAMLPYYNQRAYGNPNLTHKPGWEAFEAIMKSRDEVAKSIGCKAVEEINYVPGETEANNLALIGAAFSLKERGKKIVISDISPINILHVTELLKKYGFTVEQIPVDAEGVFNLEKLDETIDEDTIIVSLSTVNNEIGTIEPIRDALEVVRDSNSNTVFHTDASDAYGKIPFNVRSLDVDLATVSSYKILGPRGVAALYAKEGVTISSILEGQFGTQRLWPGVENTPLIVGFAKAVELTFRDFERNVNHMRRLRDKLLDEILMEVSEVKLNGPKGERRAPDNVNVSFIGCEGEALTIELSLNGIYVSSGSACTRRLLEPSHVLVAIGRGHVEAHGSILFKVARTHTREDVDYALEIIPKAVQRIRNIAGSMEVK